MPAPQVRGGGCESFEVVEVCAGAGGQALGLERAGFDHAVAVELDGNACNTLRNNRPAWKIVEGDVANRSVWRPADFQGVSLLAGGVPCPPFSIAGKQLGADDERDLFAWAVEQVAIVKPRALLLENVRGLSLPRFAGYRQHILDRLTELRYVPFWRLLNASDHGVPQLRPRFILVALKSEDAPYFRWPAPAGAAPTVGEALTSLMGANGWDGTDAWAAKANKIAPTIVGGSKKHGGADLGPTRARRAWAELGVNGSSVGDLAPNWGDRFEVGPKLTNEMVARIQGWSADDEWLFTGSKTARYRQIGNAFPPPVAYAVGAEIMRAFKRDREPRGAEATSRDVLFEALRSEEVFLGRSRLMRLAGIVEGAELEQRLSTLSRDFDLQVVDTGAEPAYRLGRFKGFTGQTDHRRHDTFLKYRTRIS
ncbi:DNA cytosine methyltransferase [Paractinoplanes atraurantiacus]|uniref:DNA cytosine methyltransferase n=1 Tax=Paractinoplanes atraurantiacus TaxID=1036182 RepID=UPI001FE3822A|nr:DNA (cytosine-5-)-methyltransferase [Actinoplanes atraurantiacus]